MEESTVLLEQLVALLLGLFLIQGVITSIFYYRMFQKLIKIQDKKNKDFYKEIEEYIKNRE